MAQRIYDGVNNVARNTIRAYGEVSNIARNLIRGYLGDENGIARQFWGAIGFVIFNEGEFSYVPEGFDFENNFADTSISVAALSAYYLTEKLLWVHVARAIPMPQWVVNQNNLIDSNYNDYEAQILLNEIYIPIARIATPLKLRVIGKGNFNFSVSRIDGNNDMIFDVGYKAICSQNLLPKEIDISDCPYIDYIKISAPDSYEAEDDEIINSHVIQPIPYSKGRVFTNNNRDDLPGWEAETVSGDVYFVLKYYEPEGNYISVGCYSKTQFTVKTTNRFYANPRVETWEGTKINSNPDIYQTEHAIGVGNFGFHFLQEQWHTNYSGSWNTNWNKDVGKIILYGTSNILPTPTGVQNSLQLIKRIEVIGGEIPNNNE